MNQFKKWLSYLVDIPLEHRSNPLNPQIDVLLCKGRYQLVTQNAVYSFDDKYINFKAAFEHLNLKQRDWESVLVLGLGLGSIPFMLEKTFHQRYNYTAVEIDEDIIDLAHQYTLSNTTSPLVCICADANAFVLQNQEQYDLICIDIFVDDYVPDVFRTSEFLESCASLLNKNGVLLFNMLYRTARDRQDTDYFYQEVFQKVFPKGYTLEVSGNLILIFEQWEA